jgi:hypothetical protein
VEFRYDDSGERIYITKGDANTIADINPVGADQVLGVARAYIPYIGYPAVLMRMLFG